jgi:dihydropteroate synthase
MKPTTPSTWPLAGRRPATAWDPGRGPLDASARPLVMGIVNLTPDSFHAASRRPEPEAAVAASLAMIAEGADVLDLGAESTRPGADPVSPAVEQDRLLPVLDALRPETTAVITVDTRHAETARLALDAGADAINDVGGGRRTDLVAHVAARDRGLVLMHMQGEPRTMQEDPRYADPVGEIGAWLAGRAAAAEAAGLARARLMVDPGIGFGKRLPHNLALLARLREVAGERPLLLGASRKGFIGQVTGAPIEARLPGSLAALAAAFAAGATMVRVHDVAASVQFLDVLAAIARADGAGGDG